MLAGVAAPYCRLSFPTDTTPRRSETGTFPPPNAYSRLEINPIREALRMFCPNCGKEFAERVNFCCQCGTALFTPAARRKPLSRSRTNRKIAGVCAGFAEYLDLDPTLIRILWVMLVIFGGCGLLAYLIAWIIMPEEPLLQVSATPAPAASPQVSPSR